MDGFGIRSHGSFFECLGQRGVGVAGACNVFARGAILHCQRSLGDHLASIGPYDVNPENPVCLRVGENLHRAVGFQVGLGTGVCTEGEGADPVGDVVGSELLFALADPSHFRIGVHDRRDAGVVDVTVAFLDVLDHSNALLLGLVGQHGAKGNVANAANVWNLGPILRVDYDAASLVQFQSDVFETQTAGVGSSANGDEYDVGVKLLGREG